jgi:hypothetical protein
MKRAFLVAACLLLLVSDAQPQHKPKPKTENPFLIVTPESEWKYITLTSDKVSVYYSPKRTVRRGTIIRAWIKYVTPDTDLVESHTIDLEEFNCSEGRRRNLQSTTYLRHGAPRSETRPSRWGYPTPESIGETIFDRICASGR